MITTEEKIKETNLDIKGYIFTAIYQRKLEIRLLDM